MLRTKAPPITRYDYQEMREGPPYYQVIEGDLVMSPSPNTFHQIVTGRIYSQILRFLERHPLGEVFIAPLDIFLGETDVYQPDVMFVSNARRSIITDHGLEGAPDLVIEILSTTTARLDRGAKRKIYARTGVQELWLIDPETKSMAVYRLDEDAETPAATLSANAVFETRLLPGLKFETTAIFKSSLVK